MDAAITDLFCKQIESKKQRTNSSGISASARINLPASPVLLNLILFLSLYHKGLKNSILPGGGINIVASGLHTHLAGISLLYDVSRVALS